MLINSHIASCILEEPITINDHTMHIKLNLKDIIKVIDSTINLISTYRPAISNITDKNKY